MLSMSSRSASEAAFAIGFEPAFGVELALRLDPATERVAIDGIGSWNAGVTGGDRVPAVFSSALSGGQSSMNSVPGQLVSASRWWVVDIPRFLPIGVAP
jgi:hypothetical protein